MDSFEKQRLGDLGRLLNSAHYIGRSIYNGACVKIKRHKLFVIHREHDVNTDEQFEAYRQRQEQRLATIQKMWKEFCDDHEQYYHGYNKK
jgi:hypothetical protein